MENSEKNLGMVRNKYNQDRKESNIERGSKVMLKVNARTNALEPRFEGPYEVIDRKGPDVKLRRRKKIKWHHLSRCKFYSERTLTLVPTTRATVGTDPIIEVSGSRQNGVNEATSRDQHEVVTTGWTRPVDKDNERGDSREVLEARRYPVRERKTPQYFGDAIPWAEVGRGTSRKGNPNDQKDEKHNQ